MRYNTISQIGTFTALDASTPDYLLLDPTQCTGGDDAPVRTSVEDAPGADGALILPALKSGQIITLAGALIVTSAGDEDGYFAAEDTLQASLLAALDALMAAPDDLVHSGGTLSVWKYAQLDGSRSGTIKTVTFGLIVDVNA